MREDSLPGRMSDTTPIPDPTGSADFAHLRLLRRKFSNGGLPVNRRPEDDARIVVFCVLKGVLELLAEFSRRIRRGERVRLLSKEQPTLRGRLILDLVILPVDQKEGW